MEKELIAIGIMIVFSLGFCFGVFSAWILEGHHHAKR